MIRQGARLRQEWPKQISGGQRLFRTGLPWLEAVSAELY
jgi:hypothetical protein